MGQKMEVRQGQGQQSQRPQIPRAAVVRRAPSMSHKPPPQMMMMDQHQRGPSQGHPAHAQMPVRLPPMASEAMPVQQRFSVQRSQSMNTRPMPPPMQQQRQGAMGPPPPPMQQQFHPQQQKQQARSPPPMQQQQFHPQQQMHNQQRQIPQSPPPMQQNFQNNFQNRQNSQQQYNQPQQMNQGNSRQKQMPLMSPDQNGNWVVNSKNGGGGQGHAPSGMPDYYDHRDASNQSFLFSPNYDPRKPPPRQLATSPVPLFGRSDSFNQGPIPMQQFSKVQRSQSQNQSQQFYNRPMTDMKKN